MTGQAVANIVKAAAGRAGLQTFLGHSDATRVGATDAVAWKDALLARKTRDGKPLATKTVRETCLAAARTVFGYGVGVRLLTDNAFSGIKVLGPKRVRLRGLRLATWPGPGTGRPANARRNGGGRGVGSTAARTDPEAPRGRVTGPFNMGATQ